MDVRITRPSDYKGKRGHLLSLIGDNKGTPMVAEVQWQDGTVEDLHYPEYYWEYLPTNVNGYDNWSMFNDNKLITS
jgi:hypothetical protein